jgi:hypothetical protein
MSTGAEGIEGARHFISNSGREVVIWIWGRRKGF